ncbi:MAG: VapC toxin family PIN domain ribonuclease [Acidimicrobiales bacterium]
MAQYLGDKSALARVHHDDVLHRVTSLYLTGQIATCGLIDLDLLYSARGGPDHHELLLDRRLLPRVTCGDQALDRAIEVQGELAHQGRHRAVGIECLVVAAAAELAGLTVMHYDREFDLIAAVTGQPTEWVVPPGTVP